MMQAGELSEMILPGIRSFETTVADSNPVRFSRPDRGEDNHCICLKLDITNATLNNQMSNQKFTFG